MKKLKEIKEVVFKGFSLKKLMLTILCSIVVSSFIGLTIAFVKSIESYELAQFVSSADANSEIVKEIARANQETYGEVINEQIQHYKEEYGEDYPAEGLMISMLVYHIRSSAIVNTYLFTLLIGTIMGIAIYIIFVQKAKGVQMLLEIVTCFAITLLIASIINLGYNQIFNAIINKYGNGGNYSGYSTLEDLYGFNIVVPFIGVFALVYVANVVHQKILANKLNKKLNRE